MAIGMPAIKGRFAGSQIQMRTAGLNVLNIGYLDDLIRILEEILESRSSISE